ncbi:CLIP domain-containing serine protease HP8-like isoform X2 [Plodia interpunctella]|uniref:CLIP domain-containing serine protease HP8-like isoform X2 n=1 Tax=Plodia interpunctella TaxID=58824 RepID=UPI0023686FBA|nr:CLIP domain-containing serine protease HP8-like isoform X2 [Plodia interpunctella]
MTQMVVPNVTPKLSVANTRIFVSAWFVSSPEIRHHPHIISHTDSKTHMVHSPKGGVRRIFTGESCEIDGQLGSCSALEKCKPLVAEVKRAGSPMPLHMRKKLQKLNCGFDFDEPLVCCVSTRDDTNGAGKPMWHNVDPDDVPSRGKPKPDVWNKGPNLVPNPLDGNPFVDAPPENYPPGDIRNHPNFHLLPTDCGLVYENDRILGGKRTSLFEMPWMVLIAYDSARGRKLSCGATLISEWYVLTAAHCVTLLGDRLTLRGVVLGEHDVRQDPDCERTVNITSCAPSVLNVDIDEVQAHTGYTRQTLHDDIALIRLAEPANFSLDSMKPICLPTTPELQKQDLVGHLGVVAGWGATEDGLQSPILLSVELPVISNKDCMAAYNGTIRLYDGQLCAGGVPDKDSCGGDSGGPLMYYGSVGGVGNRMVQRGIVSYGSKRCGIGGFPGVYTRVGSYMKWILDHMRD